MSSEPQAARGELDSPHDGVPAAISRGMVAIYKDHVGRGPTRARTTISDNLVVTVLEEGLTKAEQKLVEVDRGGTVRTIRREFQDAMRADMSELVERVTKRKVKVLLSDQSADPDYAVEVLVLEPST